MITMKPITEPIDREIEVTVSIVFAESVLKEWAASDRLCHELSSVFTDALLYAEGAYTGVEAL